TKSTNPHKPYAKKNVFERVQIEKKMMSGHEHEVQTRRDYLLQLIQGQRRDRNYQPNQQNSFAVARFAPLDGVHQSNERNECKQRDKASQKSAEIFQIDRRVKPVTRHRVHHSQMVMKQYREAERQTDNECRHENDERSSQSSCPVFAARSYQTDHRRHEDDRAEDDGRRSVSKECDTQEQSGRSDPSPRIGI